MSGKKKRKLHFGEEVWHYQIASWRIVIWEPSGKKHLIDVSDIVVYIDDLDEDYHPAIWPSDIKRYIEENLMEESGMQVCPPVV